MDKLDAFKSKLWQEQLNAMAKGFKLEERKNLFVVALFGLAGYGSGNSDPSHFYYLYYTPTGQICGKCRGYNSQI